MIGRCFLIAAALVRTMLVTARIFYLPYVGKEILTLWSNGTFSYTGYNDSQNIYICDIGKDYFTVDWGEGCPKGVPNTLSRENFDFYLELKDIIRFKQEFWVNYNDDATIRLYPRDITKWEHLEVLSRSLVPLSPTRIGQYLESHKVSCRELQDNYMTLFSTTINERYVIKGSIEFSNITLIPDGCKSSIQVDTDNISLGWVRNYADIIEDTLNKCVLSVVDIRLPAITPPNGLRKDTNDFVVRTRGNNMSACIADIQKCFTFEEYEKRKPKSYSYGLCYMLPPIIRELWPIDVSNRENFYRGLPSKVPLIPQKYGIEWKSALELGMVTKYTKDSPLKSIRVTKRKKRFINFLIEEAIALPIAIIAYEKSVSVEEAAKAGFRRLDEKNREHEERIREWFQILDELTQADGKIFIDIMKNLVITTSLQGQTELNIQKVSRLLQKVENIADFMLYWSEFLNTPREKKAINYELIDKFLSVKNWTFGSVKALDNLMEIRAYKFDDFKQGMTINETFCRLNYKALNCNLRFFNLDEYTCGIFFPQSELTSGISLVEEIGDFSDSLEFLLLKNISVRYINDFFCDFPIYVNMWKVYEENAYQSGVSLDEFQNQTRYRVIEQISPPIFSEISILDTFLAHAPKWRLPQAFIEFLQLPYVIAAGVLEGIASVAHIIREINPIPKILGMNWTDIVSVIICSFVLLANAFLGYRFWRYYLEEIGAYDESERFDDILQDALGVGLTLAEFTPQGKIASKALK